MATNLVNATTDRRIIDEVASARREPIGIEPKLKHTTGNTQDHNFQPSVECSLVEPSLIEN